MVSPEPYRWTAEALLALQEVSWSQECVGGMNSKSTPHDLHARADVILDRMGLREERKGGQMGRIVGKGGGEV